MIVSAKVLHSVCQSGKSGLPEELQDVASSAVLDIDGEIFTFHKRLGDRGFDCWHDTGKATTQVTDPTIIVMCLEALGWEVD
jgi:hypothetical protein